MWHKSVQQLILFLCIGLSVSLMQAANFKPIKQLAERRVPWLVPQLRFEKIKTTSHNFDEFRLSSEKGKIVIAANTVNAAAKALNYYLENFCHRSMSHMGDNLKPVAEIPLIPEPVKVKSVFQYRYALNYTTLNYTMAFYDWNDWQRELDWMALHGVNLMLAPIGAEAVWQETLQEFGFSKEEVFNFLPGPGFNAWWLMGNLEGWGGPITQNRIDRRTALQQKILKRMSQLGIEPVLQGFYGMVPHTLGEHFPKANIKDQGRWAGGFIRPGFLMPSDPLFKKMAEVYYQKTRKLYGKNIKFFGGDPFHEGGLTSGVDLSLAGKTIQQQMQAVFPGSTWILQGWQANPRAELLSDLDKSKVLVVQLAGEKARDWERRKGFENTPFIWCTVNNYGDQANSYGKLDFFTTEIEKIRKSPYGALCKGVGIMPEGIHNNPVTYDLMLDLAWYNRKVKVSEWIKKYVQYRYGNATPEMLKAWDIFLKTIYSSPEKDWGLPPENIICARPGWGLKVVSTWGGVKRHYDMALYEKGLKMFLSAAPQYQNTATYEIDAIDFTRQAIANKALEVYHKIENAYQEKDVASYKRFSDLFLILIRQEDALLNFNPHFRLSTWLQAAENLGETPEEKALMLKNAKWQITLWGPENNPKTDLHEYAAKEWRGLLRTYYLPRWEMFFKQQLEKIQGKPTEAIDYYAFEKRWITQKIKPESKKAEDFPKLIYKILKTLD